MNLREWRKNNGYSQESLASELEKHANECEKFKKHPPKKGELAHKLPQRTLGYWEKNTMPRKFWLGVLADFTKNKVTSADFVASVQ